MAWLEGARRGGIGLAVLAAIVACGSPSRPPIDTNDVAGTDAGPSPGSLHLEGGAAPACPTLPDGGTCGCVDLPLITDQPNLFFLLDRSGSMSENNKWSIVRQVVADVIVKLGPRARFGAALFPDPRAGACGPGLEVMAPRLGDAPSGSDGPTVAEFTASTAYLPGGGTPLAATVAALAPELTALPQRTFLILATDGGPNCDSSITCGVSECIPNIEGVAGCPPGGPKNCCEQSPADCLDTSRAEDAIGALAQAGVRTYVIGVPGSGPYGAVLDRLASAGRTARGSEPLYYAVSTTDEAALAAALRAIAAQITAKCTLTLSQAPPDPSQVNVYLDGAVVPQDPTNGWTLAGTTVTLAGETCTRVTSGDALDLRVIVGCPTVVK